ncbi:MAG TPA: hypothetical protein VGE00_01695 [Gammaproteobacteria bacterium]
MGMATLLTAAGISIACSLLISAFLSKPLYYLLDDLCGTQTRARFWHHYATIMLQVVPLLMVMLFFHAESSFDPQLLRRTLICVLLGQVIALTTIGFKLAGFSQGGSGVSEKGMRDQA